jgi:hypothetical protein
MLTMFLAVMNSACWALKALKQGAKYLANGASTSTANATGAGQAIDEEYFSELAIRDLLLGREKDKRDLGRWLKLHQDIRLPTLMSRAC